MIEYILSQLDIFFGPWKKWRQLRQGQWLYLTVREYPYATYWVRTSEVFDHEVLMGQEVYE